MSKSSVGRFRCGSALLALSLLAVATDAAEEDDAWLERSRTILERAQQEGAPSWLRTTPAEGELERARGIAQQAASSMFPEAGTTNSARPAKTIIFGSMALPMPTLIALLSEASEPGVVFVLRGVPKGKTIQDAVRRLGELAQTKIKKTPNVIIDPTLFKRHAVTVVPTLVTYVSPPHAVRMEGDITVSAFHRLASGAARGEDVSLARRGEVHDIGEPDLIVEMQRRLASIDWQQEKRRAMQRFWQRKADFVRLPDTEGQREYLIDPSVRVTEDLQDANGVVLIRAGDTVNPLRWTTLTKTVIAFRGTDERHIRRALDAAQRARSDGRGVILLTSEIDTSRAWESLSELEKELKGTVYVLPRVLAERFQLQRLPATVSAEGNRLRVRELALEETTS